MPHLAAGEHAAAVGSKGGTKGLIAKDLKLLGSYAQKDSFPFAMYWLKLVKSIKIVEESKNSKPNFDVLSVTRTTTFSRYVYTAETCIFTEGIFLYKLHV
jgi:hypothetical protein